MTDEIGVGIIGASVDRGPNTNAHLPWARSAHVPAIQALPQYRLRAVSTTKIETARIAAQTFGAEHGFGDARQLIELPDIDLVVVSVRVPYHYELVGAALDAGKHVYCEWPLALTTEEAGDLAARAANRKVQHMVGLQARAAPAFCYVKDLLRQGYVGDPLSVNVSFAVPTWGREVEAPVAYLHDAANNATLLSIYGGHTLDVICDLLGDVRELSALITRRYETTRIIETGETREKTAPDQIIVQGTLESGCVLSLHLQGGVRNLRGVEIAIRGTAGDLKLTTPGIIEVSPMTVFGALSTRSSGSSVEAAASKELEMMSVPPEYRHVPPELGEGPAVNVGELYVRLGDAILGSGACAPGFDVAAQRQALLDSIIEAAESGRRVSPG